MKYNATSFGVKISVESFFLSERSFPHSAGYGWAYYLSISNCSAKSVHVIGRMWQIYDERGNVEKIEGDGLVGQQPLIHPDGSFHYTSAVQLATCFGIMTGHYLALIEGEKVLLDIPTFALDSPFSLKRKFC